MKIHLRSRFGTHRLWFSVPRGEGIDEGREFGRLMVAVHVCNKEFARWRKGMEQAAGLRMGA